MMELTCAFVLTFISLSASTPHGYGVNSGALAKAQASAVAGSYGGLAPLSASGGAGFSGSFSKSSSSNFAASSASSSSGSFSYTGVFTGIGPNGLPTPSGSGCATAACQNGANAPHSGPSGAGSVGFGQAQSGAAAGSVAGQYNNPCTGDCSNSKPSNCAGSDCASNTNKCTSGQCDNEDSDDIYVNTSGTKKNHDNSYTPKYPSISGPACTTGNCKTTDNSNDKDDGRYKPACTAGICKPSDNSNGEDDGSYKPENSSGSPEVYPDNDHPGQYQTPNKPSSYLSTPKETYTPGSKCNSPNCKNPDSYSGNLPSSYNVPVHGSYPGNPQQSIPKCSGVNCNNNYPDASHSPSNGNSISTNYITPSQTTGIPQVGAVVSNCNTPGCDTTALEKDYPNFVPLQAQKGSSNCASSNCAGYPLQGSGPTNFASPTYPKYPQVGAPSGQGPLSHTTSACGTPNCDNTQSHPNAPSFGTPSHVAPLGPVSSNCVSGNCGAKPTTFGTPPYPAPSNCASGNCGGVPSPSSTKYNLPNFYKPLHDTLPASATGCTSGNCPSYSPIHANAGPSGGFNPSPGAYKPTDQKLPVYNGGFGGPSGLLKPNDYSPPSKPFQPVQNTKPHLPTSSPQGPIPTAVSPPLQGDIPKHPPAIHTPSTQTAAPFPPFHQVGSTSNAVAAASAAAYTGGFGGPPGLLKPFDDRKGGPSGQSNPISPNYTPQGNLAQTRPSGDLHGNSLSGYQGGPSPNKDSQHGSGGCNSGCGSGGHLESTHPPRILGGADAESYYGLAGSFASSSSSAHAASGAVTKGGYGRK